VWTLQKATQLLHLRVSDVDVPAQGNSHVASPDGVSAQDDGSTDGVSIIYTDWSVQHEQSLLPMGWPDVK